MKSGQKKVSPQRQVQPVQRVTGKNFLVILQKIPVEDGRRDFSAGNLSDFTAMPVFLREGV
jgi:hypothetical protein